MDTENHKRRIDISKQLGLSSELKKADLIAAALRKGRDGTIYYDFDLALAVSPIVLSYFFFACSVCFDQYDIFFAFRCLRV